jgi:hypothetical protein
MDWREDFSPPFPISLSPDVPSRLEDEKEKRLVCSGGVLSPREPTEFNERGRFSMHTQIKEPKMRSWAGIIIALFSLALVLYPIVSSAEEKISGRNESPVMEALETASPKFLRAGAADFEPYDVVETGAIPPQGIQRAGAADFEPFDAVETSALPTTAPGEPWTGDNFSE